MILFSLLVFITPAQLADACPFAPPGQNTTAEQFFDKGKEYFAKGKCAEAVEAYEVVLSLVPKHACAANGIAWILLMCKDEKQRDPVKALAYAEKAISDDGIGCGPCWDTLALACNRFGDTEGTHTAHVKSMTLTSPGEDEEATGSYIAFLAREKAYAGGNAATLAAMYSKKEGAVDIFAAGRAVLYQKNDPGAAVDYFTVALLIDPGNAQADEFHRQRAEAWSRLKERFFAYYDASAAIEKSSKNWQAYLLRAGILGEEGRIDEALRDYTEAVKNSDHPEIVHLKRGGALAAVDRYAEAITDFDRAVELSPGEAAFRVVRGLFWKQKGDLAKALEDMKKALELDPGSVVAQRELKSLEEARKTK